MREFKDEYTALKELNNVIHLHVKNELLNLAVAKLIIKERLELAKNDYSLIFTDLRNIDVLLKEAKDYLEKVEAKQVKS